MNAIICGGKSLVQKGGSPTLTRALLRVSLDFEGVHCSNYNLTWSLKFSVFFKRWVQAKLKWKKFCILTIIFALAFDAGWQLPCSAFPKFLEWPTLFHCLVLFSSPRSWFSLRIKLPSESTWTNIADKISLNGNLARTILKCMQNCIIRLICHRALPMERRSPSARGRLDIVAQEIFLEISGDISSVKCFESLPKPNIVWQPNY